MVLIIIGGVVAYKVIEKSVTNRAGFNFTVENFSSNPVNTVTYEKSRF